MAKFRGSGGASGIRNNKLIYATIAVLMIIVFAGSLTLLRSVFQTETYYVLAEDVPTRTQLTPEMLRPVTASKGTSPSAALGIADVQAGTLYTKFPLKTGEIITASNAGSFEDISTGIPDEWVVTSFSVSADNAVGGRIKRGVYFDMLVATNDQSYYPFVNVLTLDTSTSLNNASSSAAVDGEEAKSGQTSQYTVGMPPKDAAILQQIMAKNGNQVKLLLSPRQNEYAAPQLAQYSGKFTFDGSTKNMGHGTDYTFTPLKRDAFGRPIEKVSTCSGGNAKVDAKLCAGNTGTTGSASSSAATPSAPATN